MNSAKRVNIFALILVLLQVFANFIGGSVEKLLGINQYYLIFLFEILFLIVPAIIFIIVTKVPVKETLRLNKLTPLSILMVLGIFALSAPIVDFLNIVSQIFFHNFVTDVIMQINKISFLELILITAVTPAICEEITLRGVILSGYKNININKAALMDGLIFGIIHMNPNQFVYAFAMGTLFAYVVYITNSIFASMICHFLFNGLSTSLAYILLKILPAKAISSQLSQNTSAAQLGASATLFFIFSLICFPLLILLLNALQNENRRWIWGFRAAGNNAGSIDASEPEKEKIMTWHIYAIITIFIVFILLLQFIFKVPIFK